MSSLNYHSFLMLLILALFFLCPKKLLAFAWNFSNKADGEICFFAGWPSLVKERNCQLPWEVANNPILKNRFNVTYDSTYNCRENNHIRCSPALYPPSTQNPKGLCVPFNVYIESSLTAMRKCKEISEREQENLVETPEIYFQDIAEIVKACRNDDTHDCFHLINHLEQLGNLEGDCEGQNLASYMPFEGNYIQSFLNSFSAHIPNNQSILRTTPLLTNSDSFGIFIPRTPKPPIPESDRRELLETPSFVRANPPYMTYGSDLKRYGTPRTIWRIQEVGNFLSNPQNPEDKIVINIGNISYQNRGPTPPHKTHHNGTAVDFRLVGSDGHGRECTIRECTVSGCTVSEPNCYSRDKTYQAIKAFIDVDPRNIQRIYINDPELRRMINRYARETYQLPGDLARACEGHNNHVHINFNN